MPEVGQGREGVLDAARELAGAALAALEASRQRIDDLNVYPVPDGDTGTNMALTGRAVVDALARSSASDPGDLAREATRAALMGARGNSGVILSQLVRGSAESLASASEIDGRAVAAALRASSDAAYAAVREPKEGTILTVARALAERAEQVAASGSDPGEVLAAAFAAGETALGRTREQLPQLREAGVVDAGGAGLLELVRGIAGSVRGEPLPELPPGLEHVPLEAIHLEPSRYRYCTSFYVEGDGADPAALERDLAAFGDSLLVVGSPGAVKAHVHTDDPGRALTLATAVGVVEEVDVKNMHVQTADRELRLVEAASECAAVAVVAGDGNRRLFESLGAVVVDGGESMNPATAAIVAAVERARAAEIVVLPNNPNVLMAAERAAGAASRSVHVVPTRSLQAGLGAMVAFDPLQPGAENVAAMTAAAASVRAGAVTRASRTAKVDGVTVAEGEYLGLVEGTAVEAGSELGPVFLAVARRLADGAGVLTVILGEGAEPVDGLLEPVRAANEQLEVEVHEGGQPHYPYLLAAE